MRTPLFGFFILLHCLNLAADQVAMTDPMVRLVPTLEHLRRMCATSGDYDACTRFIAYRLTAGCVQHGPPWRMRAAATFRPWILLRNIRQLPHEREHIEDVRRSVERYVARLEEAEFPGPESCAAAALNEVSRFGETMRGFARESNGRHHPAARRH